MGRWVGPGDSAPASGEGSRMWAGNDGLGIREGDKIGGGNGESAPTARTLSATASSRKKAPAPGPALTRAGR